jgi:hypothetical protein
VVGQRLLGVGLGVAVQGGGDGQAAAEQQLDPVLALGAEDLVVEDRLEDEVAEERDLGVLAAVLAHPLRRVQRQRGGLGRVGVGLRDQPHLRHPREDDVASLQRRVRVARRVVRRGLLHDPREQRGLWQCQVTGMRVEVPLGGRLHAVRAGSEERDVEVALEDLLLAVLLLQRDGVAELAQLAGVGLRDRRLLRRRPLLRVLDVGGGLEQHLLDVLLGQGRATLHVLAGLVVHQRPDGAAQVDAAVIVEAGVLDRDDGLAHDRGDVGDRHRDAVLVVERRDQRAVGGQDAGPLGQRRDLELGRQRLEPVRAVPRDQPQPAEHGQGDACDEQAAQAADHDEQDEPGHEPGVVPWSQTFHRRPGYGRRAGA